MVDRFEYVTSRFGMNYDTIWHDVGYLVVFVAAGLLAAIFITARKSHMKR
jgi:TRAP-type C4-dicarboxylate transport system permease small subunit